MLANNNPESLDYDAASALIMMGDVNPSDEKRRRYNDDYANVVYKAGYTNMQNEHFYNHQRNHALQMQAARHQARLSPAFSFFSSTESYRSTPSPDFALSASQTSSPVFMGFQQIPASATMTSLQYYRPTGDTKPTISTEKTVAEHNYAISSASSATTEGRSNSLSPDLRERPNEGRRAPSDSGNSSMPDEISPLCMNDWYRDLLKNDFAGRLQQELGRIAHRSAFQKEQFLAARLPELPSDLEYNPNKSRLRKVYQDASEAAERERNNLASRKSRFKKKIAQQITNMHLEFDRNENAQLYAIQNWIGKVIFELESKWLDRGAPSDALCQLRQYCGFPQNQPDKGFLTEPF